MISDFVVSGGTGEYHYDSLRCPPVTSDNKVCNITILGVQRRDIS